MNLRSFEIYHLFTMVEFAKFLRIKGLKRGSENIRNDAEQFFSASFYFIDVIETLEVFARAFNFPF